MDMSTARAVEPTFTATWHPNKGPAVILVRAHDREVYEVCVRHFQANFRGMAEPLIVDEVSEYLERSRQVYARKRRVLRTKMSGSRFDCIPLEELRDRRCSSRLRSGDGAGVVRRELHGLG